MVEPSATPLAMPVETVDLLAGLLSHAEASPTEEFYSRMAAVVCRAASLRRAVIFAYDDERRMVRAMGSHGIELELFAGASPTAEQVAIARRALAEDTVVEVTDDVERDLAETSSGTLDPDLVAESARPPGQRAACAAALSMAESDVSATFADQAGPTIAWLIDPA